MFLSSTLQLATLIQQRAFLNAFNQTAFQIIQQLATDLIDAREDALNATKSIQFLNDNLTESIQRLDYLILINESSAASVLHIKQKQCLLQISQLLWQFERESVLRRRSVPSSTNEQLTVASLTAQYMNLKEVELNLIDNFYSAKFVVSPRATLLRTILKTVMKLRVQILNMSSTRADVDKSLPYSDSSECMTLTRQYVDMLNHIGSRASDALSRLDLVNNRLEKLIQHNRVVRMTYPRTNTQLQENSFSSLVIVSIHFTKEVDFGVEEANILIAQNFKSNLLSLVFNSIICYLALFFLVEWSFSRCGKMCSSVKPADCKPTVNVGKIRSGKINNSYIPPNMVYHSQIPLDQVTLLRTCKYCNVQDTTNSSIFNPSTRTQMFDSPTPTYRCRNNLYDGMTQFSTFSKPTILLDPMSFQTKEYGRNTFPSKVQHPVQTPDNSTTSRVSHCDNHLSVQYIPRPLV
ncbi:hypothetical protein EG68_01116 [Paragonimus skrjabini miyazakii]|uniref:Uncharacterized protein n=1 Tax=Paragonimus skrjabini miyazakii TaxID=59628 RepID=A0A8S9Z2N5_9TREM|nr:hypothetical protein EG68_01116 [Paragonimus skrjabini miyazakii]